MIRLVILLTLLALVSCEHNKVLKTGISKGDCFLEVDKRYSWGSNKAKNIYKIEDIDIKNDSFVVSLFKKDKSKHYLGKKKHDYFQEGQYFVYKQTLCPDGSSKRGITDRIKSLNI